MDYRIEKDTIGEVKVLKHALWGPQTQRSINNFKIGRPEIKSMQEKERNERLSCSCNRLLQKTEKEH